MSIRGANREAASLVVHHHTTSISYNAINVLCLSQHTIYHSSLMEWCKGTMFCHPIYSVFYSFCPDGCWYVSPGTCKTASSPPPHAVFWHLSVTSCSVISRKGKVTTFILREQILPWWGASSNVTTAQENDMSLDGLGDMKVTAHMLQLFRLPSRPKWTLAAHTWPWFWYCFFHRREANHQI